MLVIFRYILVFQNSMVHQTQNEDNIVECKLLETLCISIAISNDHNPKSKVNWVWGATSFGILTHSQKKNAISNAFWNRIMCIKWRTSLGRWNQKKSSEGVTATSPSIAVCFWATSTANSVMICSILLPTTSSNCK